MSDFSIPHACTLLKAVCSVVHYYVLLALIRGGGFRLNLLLI